MINFNKFYKLFNLISLGLVVISILLLFFKGLNFGVDFKGGTLIELRSNDKNINVTSLRQSFSQMNLGDFNVKKFGNENDFLIKIEKKDTSANAIEVIKKDLTSSLGGSFNFRRVENVGPKVSSELLKSGIIAIALSLAAMLFYIWIRFEWQFSLGAILALFHDVIITLGLFSLFSLEINLSIVAAVLTIVGYSMNDTVVIYDRVRENLRKSFNKMNLGDFNVKKFGNENDFLIKIEKKDTSANAIEVIKKDLTSTLGGSFNFRRVENVGPKVSSE